MDTITINKQDALAAIGMADKAIKPVLEKLLGVIKLNDYKEIDSFEKALPYYEAKHGKLSDDEQWLLNTTSDSLKSERHHLRLRIIIDVINQGWIPDYNDKNQRKWELVIDLSGVGLSLYYCGLRCTNASVGSRLCFADEERGRYTFKTFIKEYEGLFKR